MLSADAIVIVSLEEDRVTFANPAAAKMFSLKSSDPVSSIASMLTSISAEDQEYVRNRYVVASKQASTTNLEFRWLQSSGEIAWLNATTYLFDKNRFVLVVVRDVTEARHHEDYLVEFGASRHP